VLIGQAYGAGDEHRVKKVAGTVLGATLLFSLLTAIVGTLLSPAVLSALGTPASIIGQSDAYTRIVFISGPVLFLYLVYTSFLRGVGDSQTPLWFLIGGTLLGIALTPVFIAGWFGLPQLGVSGAAVAGAISSGIALIALLVLLHIRKNPLRLDREMARDMLIDWRLLWTVVRIGVPTGIQVVMVSLAEIAIISFVNRYGPTATAAYGAVNQIVGYVQFPAISIGIAASIFGAQCIGARRMDLIPKVIRSAVALNYIIGGTLITICYIFAKPLLSMFVSDENTIATARTLLEITLWSYLIFGNSAVISGIMRSSGTVLVPTINGLIGIWIIEIPVAYFCMQKFGLPGVWVGYPAFYCFMLVAQYTYFRFFWQKKTHERLV
jgi:putative MATE family efflux protein